MVSKVCSRSQGQPPGARSRAMIETAFSNFSPVDTDLMYHQGGFGEDMPRRPLARLLADAVGFYGNARSNVCNEPKSASNGDVNVSSTVPLRASPGSQQFDVLVIGGGINGVAIARECALSGKRT